MEYRRLVKDDGPISLLGFGCMRLPLVPGSDAVDEAKAAEMIDKAIKSGVNYFDTAYRYLNGNSELFLGKTLKKYPRDSFHLATKLPMGMIHDTETGKKIYHEQFEKLQVEYFDFYLLHGINAESYQRAIDLGLVDYLVEEKKAGKIRHLGFSFHGSYEDFEKIITSRAWDFCQIQLNYMDAEIQAGVKGAKLAEKLGVPLVIMEPVKGGSLANFAPEAAKVMKAAAPDKSLASWAVRWVAKQPSVAVVLSGMSTMEQVEDNLATFSDYKPLSKEEEAIVAETAEKIRASVNIGCTGCQYCMPCPFGVNIPRNFALWNELGMYNNPGGLRFGLAGLKESGFADMCQKCGACEAACPQGLQIRDNLEKVVEALGPLMA
ncbi:MAG: aldo/keto reductase [Oscillospiraceae bacterium]|nr:aldo/keto reductase [Oscillospiraceae bacterium]